MKIKNYAELLSEVLKMDKSLGPNGSQCFNLSKKMDAQQAINILKRMSEREGYVMKGVAFPDNKISVYWVREEDKDKYQIDLSTYMKRNRL